MTCIDPSGNTDSATGLKVVCDKASCSCAVTGGTATYVVYKLGNFYW